MTHKAVPYDKGTVVFNKDASQIVVKFSGSYLVPGKLLQRKVNFDKYKDAVMYITNRRLGFSCDEQHKAWGFEDANDWTPTKLTRYRWSPAKGYRVSEMKLSNAFDDEPTRKNL